MKKLKKTIYLLAILTIISCEVIEINCKEFDKSNVSLDYTMFQEGNDNYNFINQQNDTVKLSSSGRYFSESYIERCGGFADPNCDCFSSFEEIYRVNDSLFFRTQITASVLEDESKFIDIDYSVNYSRNSESRLINNKEIITNKFSEITQEELILDNYRFTNVIQLNLIKNERDNSLINQLVIKKNEGLIAFMKDGKIYLKEK
jgi:hypothetical protein